MNFQKELIRPSRNKHRSNAVMTMRLLERRETVSQLEQSLTRAKADLHREKTTSSGLWKQVKAKQEQLEQNLKAQERHFEVNEEIKKKALGDMEREEELCQLMKEESERLKEEMENIDQELAKLEETMKLLTQYQNSMSDVEGFDRVVTKFQELNSTWQEMSDEYRSIMMGYRVRSLRSEHATEREMRRLLQWIERDSDHKAEQLADASRQRVARNSAWKVNSFADTSRQLGSLYLGIINLASHLNEQIVCQTLTNLKSVDGSKRGSKEHKKSSKKDLIDLFKDPRISEKWQKFADIALAEHRLKGESRTPESTSDVEDKDSIISKESELASSIGKTFSIKVSTAGTDESERKIDNLNRSAVSKLQFIEQILTDLTLVKEEIEFHTDPINYNDPGNSYIT